MINDDYEQLGNYSKSVTISSQEGQKWINRGLLQLFSFNHIESVNCFKRALELDQNCAIAHWGVAYGFGPHYNFMFYNASEYSNSRAHLQEAVKLADSAMDWEKDIILASQLRYPEVMPQGDSILETLKVFSSEMAKVFEKHPTDLDVGSLYVESIMNLRPWQLWKKNGEPHPEAVQAREILEKLINLGPHPLVYHLYIHLLELSPFVRDALKVCDGLYEMGTGLGHLLHMPSHIYIQVGDYNKAIFCNVKGVEADNQVAKRIGVYNFYSFYRFHNMHFVMWSAMFLGDYDTAIKYAEILKANLSEDVVKFDSQNLEFFYGMYLHVYIRFGKWDEILNDKIETRDDYYVCRVMQRYARCLAYGVKGMISEAEEELKQFYAIKDINQTRRIGNNTTKTVFEVAEQMALGELEYRKQNFDKAYDHLRNSVTLSDALIYAEPWDWPQPTRHALGALLLEQGHSVEAEAVYKKDMETYPDNIWSLSGLYECLVKNGKQEEATETLKRLEVVKANASKEIKYSCFCRRQGD